MEEFWKAYARYVSVEFGDEATRESLLGIAYTTYGNNEEFEVQVSYDVEKTLLITTIRESGTEIHRIEEEIGIVPMTEYFHWLDFIDWCSEAHDWLHENKGVDND